MTREISGDHRDGILRPLVERASAPAISECLANYNKNGCGGPQHPPVVERETPVSRERNFRGRNNSTLSDKGMVFPQGPGHEARKADRYEESKGHHCPEDHRDFGTSFERGQAKPALNFSCKLLVRSAGPAMSRWDDGRGDLGQSAGSGSSARRCVT